MRKIKKFHTRICACGPNSQITERHGYLYEIKEKVFGVAAYDSGVTGFVLRHMETTDHGDCMVLF